MFSFLFKTNGHTLCILFHALFKAFIVKYTLAYICTQFKETTSMVQNRILPCYQCGALTQPWKERALVPWWMTWRLTEEDTLNGLWVRVWLLVSWIVYKIPFPGRQWAGAWVSPGEPRAPHSGDIWQDSRVATYGWLAGMWSGKGLLCVFSFLSLHSWPLALRSQLNECA